jgi:DNA-binding transcriptional ArsR family regulator
MSLDIQHELVPLRAMAHPLRLQILSLTTGAALSAAELAAELGIAHAAASYHARQLADAGLLQVVEDEGDRSGPGRPPVRYRYDFRLGGHLDRSDGAEALWAATAQDMQRRIRLRTRHHVGADAEVWMAPEDFDEVCALAQRISDLMHERARAPHADGTVHASVSVYAFELGDAPAKR